MRCRTQKITKAREGEGTNNIAVEAREHVTVRVLLRVDAEMVLPEINHHLVQLSLAVACAKDCSALQLSDDHLWITSRRLRRRWFLLRRFRSSILFRLLHLARLKLPFHLRCCLIRGCCGLHRF